MDESKNEPQKNEEWHTYDLDDNRLTVKQRFYLLGEKFTNPRKITLDQRRELVFYLNIEQGWERSDIGDLLLLSKDQIYRDIKAVDREYQKALRTTAVGGWMAKLAKHADQCSHMARKSKDYDAIWKINRDFFDRLHGLGYVPNAPKQVNTDETPGTREDLVSSIVGMLAGDIGEGDEVPGVEELGLLPPPSDGVDSEVLQDL